MKTVTFDNPHRKKHFELFNGLNHPHFNVCANVEVGPWVDAMREAGQRLTSSLVYLLSRCANELPEFRQRIRDDTVVEHELVHPSFAVATRETDVFSFCEVDYTPDFAAFVRAADTRIEAMRDAPSLSDQEGRDDYLFMSPVPWIAFTSVQHPMNYHPRDCVPRITWGKIHPQGEQLLMPLAVQAHHALVDGVHMGRYFQAVEALAADPAEI